MDTNLRRGLVAEGLGTFAIVYFSAGAVCVNYLASPAANPNTSPLFAQQPGLAGIALANGLMLAAALAVTVRLSGGYLNPAITLMLWVFNRLDSKRMAAFVAVQLIAGLVAGACLRYTFENSVLQEARMGSPHLNSAAFPTIAFATIAAGTSAELILTFFLVFAIFGMRREGEDPSRVGLPAGLVLAAGSVVIYPLTGAAANPARWFGTVVWELSLSERGNPWGDTFVYLAGSILGALAAGLVTFRYLVAAPSTEANDMAPSAAITPPAKTTAISGKRK
jgi:MIP family channel proteins